jgi:alpha-tubulin suppressor-like RCC1 family protein
MAGESGSGGSTNACPEGQHNCSGECVEDDSVDHCGGRCEPCPEPEGGTAVCDDGACGIDCGPLTLCGSLCTDGCCVDDDCEEQAGKAGQCDTSDNTCRYDCAAGYKPCGSGSCIPDDACCSESDCPGSCKTCADGECVSVTSADDADSCAGSCDASGVCKSRRGQTCTTTANGCISGSQCAPDGYCCDSACGEPCKACDISGFEGTCTAVASGNPHGNRTQCSSDGSACGGSCAGRSDGQCNYPSGTCGAAPHCSGTDLVGQAQCSNGSCSSPAPMACVNAFACVGTACKTSCAADSDCVSTHFCEGGTCHLDATAVAAGVWASYALLRDGSVWAWGESTYGEIGPGGPAGWPNTSQSNVPIKVTGIGTATAVDAGLYHACALLSNGQVWCWGADSSGELGAGPASTEGYRPTPVRVQGLPSQPVTAIEVADRNSCALIGSNGQVYCWGSNILNQLGPAVSGTSAMTAAQMTGIGSATAVRTGDSTCVLASGGMYCWGDNGSGEIKLPEGGVVTTPTSVPFGGLGTVQQLDLGANHVCAVISNSAYCWGLNGAGALGDQGTAINAVASPVSVDGLGSNASRVAIGQVRSCALLTTGKVRCWGEQADGGLGNGQSASASSVPVEVLGVSDATGLAYGEWHGCALLGNGSVKCWGRGLEGELGNAASATSATPVTVKGW